MTTIGIVTFPLFALAASLATADSSYPTQGGPTAQARAVSAPAGGIWKAAVPAHAMTAEFDRFDAYGLAFGARIQADCSLNWIDPDDGRRYCFASGTSLVYFLESPRTYLAQARDHWLALKDTH